MDEFVASLVTEWADRGGRLSPPKCTDDLLTEEFGKLPCAIRLAKVAEIAPTAFSAENTQDKSEECDAETSFDLIVSGGDIGDDAQGAMVRETGLAELPHPGRPHDEAARRKHSF